jgi:hypothetical protein
VLDSNAPAVNADAHDHAERTTPKRNDAARAAKPTASSASTGAEPHNSGDGRPGANTNNQRVKWARITSAQRRNRRRQPRTVPEGTPKRSPTPT